MISEKELKIKAFEKAAEHLKEALELNDYMAENPELGSHEFNSSKAMVELLRKYGIETEYPFAGMATAYKGVINPRYKKRVAVLAEYDALKGIGHACGHCASGSASVLTALAFNDMKDDIDFGVDIIGTPDEEIEGCKGIMADNGVFDGYDFAIMVHMGPVNCAKVDFIALDGIGIKFHGAPAHAAAAPTKGRNALNAARLFFDATDMMRQHILQEARMHGIIKQGGEASNVVPDLTEIEFIARAPRRADLNGITEWVKDCARAAAMATKTELELFPVGIPFHDLYVSGLRQKVMDETFDELGMEYDDTAGMTGSSDIGNVDYVCPAFHPMAGIGVEQGCHTHEFAEAMTGETTHRAIEDSAKFMLTLIIRLYSNEELLERIKAEHREYRGL